MSKLHIFGHFLSVGKSQAKIQVIFQAKTQAKMCSIELGPRTDGPLGAPCVLPRPTGRHTHCYESCGQCDPINSCDWTACYDDIVFVRELVSFVDENYCLDTNSIHLTGYSNGGMFSYYAASLLNDIGIMEDT